MGWKVYDMETREIFVSRDITFHEDTYPFTNSEKKEVVKSLDQNLGTVPNTGHHDFSVIQCLAAEGHRPARTVQVEEIGSNQDDAPSEIVGRLSL